MLNGSAIARQAMVLTMLPSVLVEPLEETELELPLRFAIELSMNDEMIDCAGSALAVDVLPDVAPEELGALPARVAIRV